MCDKKNILADKGIIFVNSASTVIADDVNPDNIAPGVKIYGNCHIEGDRVSIASGTVIGEEGGVTLLNCQVGRDVRLCGGYFNSAVFLDGVKVGYGAHIRPGTLMEDYSSCAHTVGLKQTILMPYVTLGSLINFCDCLMAGGTDRKNHSEVGSSYVHFNYTPQQDKATASLLGDVPHGVMLDQPPVFLGGQGGLVGPSVLAYGTVIAAGTVFRGNVVKRGQLITGVGKNRATGARDYNPLIYGNIDKKIQNNFIYLGNLFALREWYKKVRMRFAGNDRFLQSCYRGALFCIESCIEERIKQLDKFSGNLLCSLNAARESGMDITIERFIKQKQFIKQWPDIQHRLRELMISGIVVEHENEFLQYMPDILPEDSWVSYIKKLNARGRNAIIVRLSEIVDDIVLLSGVSCGISV